MRTDRELLELPARAFGRWGDKSKYIENVYDYDSPHHGSAAIQWDEYCYDTWNALTNDGDCARMEAQLSIDVKWYRDSVVAYRKEIACDGVDFSDHGDDRNAARRVASIRVAAEIGKQMP